MQIRDLDTLLYGALSSLSLFLLGFYLNNPQVLITSTIVFGMSYITSILRNYITEDYDAYMTYSTAHTVLVILVITVWITGFLVAIMDLLAIG